MERLKKPDTTLFLEVHTIDFTWNSTELEAVYLLINTMVSMKEGSSVKHIARAGITKP